MKNINDIKKECCKIWNSLKDKTKMIDYLVESKERERQLEEKFNNILEVRYKTPQIERFAVVQYIHWNKKPYKIVKCFDVYKDKDMKTHYCFYGCASTNFKIIKICDTKEEAQAKLQELKGERE